MIYILKQAPRLTERRRFSGGPGGSRSARLCQGPTRLRDLPSGRPAGSYDAQSHGYLCSEVYSADACHTHFKWEGGLSGKARGRPAAQTKKALFGLGLGACAAPLGLPGSEGPALDPLPPCPWFSHSRGGHTHTLCDLGVPPSCSPARPPPPVALGYGSCILGPGGSQEAKGRHDGLQ